jgi:hypothetical protein
VNAFWRVVGFSIADFGLRIADFSFSHLGRAECLPRAVGFSIAEKSGYNEPFLCDGITK